MTALTGDLGVAYGILLARGVGALVLAALVHGFFRHYGKSYLHHWAWSWWNLAVFATSGAALASLVADGGWGIAGVGALAIVRGIAAYLHIAFLALGCWEVTRRRPARLRSVRWIVTGFAAAGAASALVMGVAGGFDATSRSAEAVVRALVAGLLFTIVATGAFIRREKDRGIGVVLVSAALLVYGVHYLYVAGAGSLRLAGWTGGGLAWVGYSEILIQMLLGLGMVSCLLEDERQAAIHATREIEHLAYHDALTGLPNRPLFVDRLIVALAQATRHRQKLAVFFLDIDRFKDINDTLGHTHGDTMLKGVADRIRKTVRAEDTVSRFGGDEFTLLVQRIDHIEDAARIAQKLLAAVKKPFVLGDHEIVVSVSIGISLFPTDGIDAETLVKNADTAMYRAKEHGRDAYEIYAPAMNARALERLALETALRKALDNGELEMYYQPLIDVRRRTIYGAEALLRWNHPEQGLLAPGRFIETLESSGLILPVGDWALGQACRQARQWADEHGRDLSVSVNLSARQFQQPDLVDRVRSALASSGLPPSSLELEITENNAMQNAENSVRTLRELKSLGIMIAVDDFGTGYSSLNYLKRFPLTTLKLDQSFVRDVTEDPGDAAIATAVISMARTLNLELVAEGVETEEQLAFLRDRGCPRLQGYLFSRPLPAAEFAAFLREPRTLDVLHRTQNAERRT
ncbi:MAG: putative bifunctional diguanylate cyclase/phosphodiesterase [Thermoanaerobaculia bacterium]